MSHGEMLPRVLFAGELLAADVTGERLWLDVGPSMHVETAALRELLAARIARVGAVSGVSTFVRRQVAGARELSVAVCTRVQRYATSNVTAVHVIAKVQLERERLAATVAHVRQRSSSAGARFTGRRVQVAAFCENKRNKIGLQASDEKMNV